MVLSSSPLSSATLSSVSSVTFPTLSGTITLTQQEVNGGFISVIGAGYIPITSSFVDNTFYSEFIENPYYSINIF